MAPVVSLMGIELVILPSALIESVRKSKHHRKYFYLLCQRKLQNPSVRKLHKTVDKNPHTSSLHDFFITDISCSVFRLIDTTFPKNLEKKTCSV